MYETRRRGQGLSEVQALSSVAPGDLDDQIRGAAWGRNG